MLAQEDLSVGHPTVTCRQVASSEPGVFLGRLTYSRIIRYLLDAVLP